MVAINRFFFSFLFIYFIPVNAQTVKTVEADGNQKSYFTILEKAGKHSLVTPSGELFFSLGINHVDNVLKDRFRDHDFMKTEEKATETIIDKIRSWNMNTCGYGCPTFLEDKIPFIVPIRFTNNGHYRSKPDFGFDDIFDEKFWKSSEEKIAIVTKRTKANPNLIGYYWTDTPRWDIEISRERHGNDWVSYLRNLPSASAGKARYVKFLQDRYQKIERFNLAYGIHFKSFNALLGARFDHLELERPSIKKDDRDFLAVIAEHLYGNLFKLFKKYDSNHLLLGEKYISGDHPRNVLEIATKYVDAISIQPGPTYGPGPGQGLEERFFDGDYFDELYEITGKPILICDHQTSFGTDEYPVTLWYQSEDQSTAADIHREYLMGAVKKPYIIGYERCQYINFYDESRGLMKQGLIDASGNDHEIVQEGVAKNNSETLKYFEKNRIKPLD